MEVDDIESFENLTANLGKKLYGFRRMFFYFEDVPPNDSACTELEFENGSVLYFRGIGGGSKLNIVGKPWADPYADYSPEDIEKVKFEYGLQRRVELIGDKPYSMYSGKKLISVVPLTNTYDFILGVELEFEAVKTKLTIFTSWDEDYVILGDNSLSLSQAHLTARYEKRAAMPIERV